MLMIKKLFPARILILVLLLLNVGVYSVNAYNDFDNISCKWENPTSLKYKFLPDTSSDWRTIHATSVVAWNSATSKANMSLDYSGATENLFGIFHENSTYLGRSVWTCKFPLFTKLSVSSAGLNETTLGLPGTTFGSYTDSDRITVALHEHGHFMGLGHSNYYAVMRDPYAGAISSPTSDDISGISSLYP